jgi:hypothetical protein
VTLPNWNVQQTLAPFLHKGKENSAGGKGKEFWRSASFSARHLKAV